jgi:hypothetical protein
VERDAGEPRAEPVRIAELVEAEPGLKHSLLNGVFGERLVAHDALAEAKCHLPMTRNKAAEGRVIATADLLVEKGIWGIAMLKQLCVSKHSVDLGREGYPPESSP